MTDIDREELKADTTDDTQEVVPDTESGIAWTSETEDEDANSPFGALAGALAPKPDPEPEAPVEEPVEEPDEPDEAPPASDEIPSSDEVNAESDDPPDGVVDLDTDAAQEEEEEEEEPEEPEEEAPPPISPYDLPGDWYVIHSYSGYEKKVKANLETRTSSMHMEDRIFEVVIPMEDVIEIKNGRKVEVPKKMFPGYILVRMYLDDDSWYTVRNTPGVTAFVGGGSKPTPLSRREVERFLGVKKEEEKKAPRFKPLWDIGETIRVVAGPFADFNGVIEDINIDQQKVKVLVEIFGRDTPMELNFEDIQKQ